MMLVRVRLRNTWITPGGKRYRRGERYIPYDELRLLPVSATILPEDDFLKQRELDMLIEAGEGNLEYYKANPHGNPNAEAEVQMCILWLAELRAREI